MAVLFQNYSKFLKDQDLESNSEAENETSMKPKTCEAKDVCYCTSKENIPPVVCQTNGKFRPQNVNGFEIIFILAILEFILTTVKQIKRKNDDRGMDF